MAYNTRHTGKITIAPPLSWAEIKRGPGLEDLRLITDEAHTDTETGRTTVITASAVAPLTEEPFTGYEMAAELQALVDAHGARHAFVGHIQGEGEETGDLWRLMVRDEQAVKVLPTIIWPYPAPATGVAHPELATTLTTLGEQFGPLAVALAAAQFVDIGWLVRQLTEHHTGGTTAWPA
ncbi:DUF6205 family protein [Nocardiopsis sp. NPDC049922]|uniref:DUF6205 family protein n=1 Tax=Nocardiopsis sp. NPDC049922 TaxID=3155157 RepID=UPI00340F3C37